MNPPAPEMAARFNISTNPKYWGKDSVIQASFPNYEYPGLGEQLQQRAIRVARVKTNRMYD
jgi:hypothetical protein